MESLIGKTLGRYNIVELLGEGGMGAVFKARDPTLQDDVAIKVMHAHFGRRQNFRERFLQEARSARRLGQNPHFVNVYDFGEEADLLYIVMELVPGDNLRQLLHGLREEGQWIVLSEAVELVRQLSLGLHYAHEKDVLHRDIKPDNVMLRPEESETLPYQPVITDLGLAKLAEGGVMTQEGVSMGTPAYMSPEQAEGHDVDARSDVYSLGILLFELATGELPFKVKTLTQAIRAHTKETPPRPRSIRPDLPQPVEALLLQALEKAPEDRYQDAEAFADALAELRGIVSDTGTERGTPEAASLITLQQKSLTEPRGTSVFDEFPEVKTPVATGQTTIQVLLPDKSLRTVTLGREELTIGRASDNDLTLDDGKASRHHARIAYDGTNYVVVDLNSTNGTYLGTTKLLPGMPEVWAPDTPLRIGDSYLRLIRGTPDRGAATDIYRTDGTLVDPSRMRTSHGEQRIGVFMEETALSVEPGGSTRASLILLNQGSVVDHFEVGVEGIPPAWIAGTPPVVRLMPGAQTEVSLTVNPPRTPESRAGRHPITVTVTSQNVPDEQATLDATLQVGRFVASHIELRPRRLQAGRPGKILVENSGNTEATYRLTWQDKADELRFEPADTTVTVPAGETAEVEYRARPKTRRWIGGRATHSFSVDVAGPGGGDGAGGELMSGGMVPAWLPPILLVFCVGLAALAWFVRGETQSRQAAATATARAAATQTTERLAQLSSTTQTAVQAATATATWLGEDEDRDGLSNEQELALNTAPDQFDTDADGLSDGEEVDRWGTDPLTADTDGDGLKDGDEVSRGIDPRNPDTDGDGELDARDPDPGRMPTLTPRPATATPMPAASTSTPVPDGSGAPSGRLVFTRSPTGLVSDESEIFVLHLGTGTVTRLTENGVDDHIPRWSPGGDSIVYASARQDRQGDYDVLIMNADGSDPRAIITTPAWDDYPAWSPDGREIAFATTADDNSEIHVQPLDGILRRVTVNPGSDEWPTWSPDGAHIAYGSERDGTMDIYVSDAAGTNARPLVSTPADENQPAWSPDEQWIAFIRKASVEDEYGDVWIVAADGTTPPRQLTTSGDAIDPAWSPDSRWIAFSRHIDNTRTDIWAIDVDGGSVRPLVEGAGHDLTASWTQ